jgi:putative transcriptional regulator
MANKKIGKLLKKARKNLGLTQVQVAEKVGISSNYYSMIERDQRENPGSQVMAKIAKVLKLKSSDIFPF